MLFRAVSLVTFFSVVAQFTDWVRGADGRLRRYQVDPLYGFTRCQCPLGAAIQAVRASSGLLCGQPPAEIAAAWLHLPEDFAREVSFVADGPLGFSTPTGDALAIATRTAA